MSERIFSDRRSAGKELAKALEGALSAREAVVLGLPRGGVPVAYEVALALGIPLDILVIRKLGAPGHPELAIGAVGSGGVRVLNERIIRSLGVREGTVERIAQEERRRVEEKEAFLRGEREAVPLKGKSVILIDDGLATGASMWAAVTTVRAKEPRQVIVAVPVAPPETVEQLRQEVDRVVCLNAPAGFSAVGEWYHHFDQTSDQEVRKLLGAAGKSA
ncbi:MAG: phosphoribosyltransferase [Alkalispirochaetaceae bacterium]